MSRTERRSLHRHAHPPALAGRRPRQTHVAWRNARLTGRGSSHSSGKQQNEYFIQ